MGREPLSRIEKILSNIVGEGSYELDPPLSDAEEILIAILNDETIDIVARDRFCTILLCILNGEEYTGVTMSRAEEILKCISEGEKYEVDEWTYENVLSRVEQLLTDWANAEDPEYSKTVSGILIHVLDAVEKPAESLVVIMEPKQEATPFIDATTKEPYLSKTASTTGNKRYLDKIVGGTVAWNQLVELSASFWNTKNSYIDVAYTNDEFQFTKTNAAGAAAGVAHGLIPNHVYIVKGQFKNSVTEAFAIIDLKDNTSIYDNAHSAKRVATNYTYYKDFEMLFKTDNTYRFIGVRQSVANPANNIAYVKNICLTDLTLMFANAPAIADYIYSLEQAEAGAGVQWLKDYGFIDDTYRAYNPGELISAKPTAFTVGSNTYALGGVDLRGLFKLDAQNNLYCDGDIYPPSGQIDERYGIVDLGTINWVYNNQAGYEPHMSATNAFANVKTPPSNSTAINGICAIVPTLPAGIIRTSERIGIGVATNGTVRMKTSDMGTDAAAFKAAMSGVYFYYELDTPTTSSSTPYTNPADIANGDTESFTDTRAVPIPVGNESHYAGEYEIEGHESVTVYHAQTQDEPNSTEYSVTFTENTPSPLPSRALFTEELLI